MVDELVLDESLVCDIKLIYRDFVKFYNKLIKRKSTAMERAKARKQVELAENALRKIRNGVDVQVAHHEYRHSWRSWLAQFPDAFDD